MPNIFDAAPTTITVKVSKSKSESRPVHAVNGLSELAAINSLMATLEGLKEGFEAQVKAEGLDIFTTLALKAGIKPETFNLVDDMSTGQFQMRKRSTASPLTEAEVAICKAYSIPTVENVKVQERFVFNPEVLQDQVAMEKISKALGRIPELKGMTIVQKQEEQKTTVIADGGIEASCALKDKAQMVAALAVSGVQALKTKFDSEEMKDAFEVLAKAGIKLVPDAPKAKAKASK